MKNHRFLFLLIYNFHLFINIIIINIIRSSGWNSIVKATCRNLTLLHTFSVITFYFNSSREVLLEKYYELEVSVALFFDDMKRYDPVSSRIRLNLNNGIMFKEVFEVFIDISVCSQRLLKNWDNSTFSFVLFLFLLTTTWRDSVHFSL